MLLLNLYQVLVFLTLWEGLGFFRRLAAILFGACRLSFHSFIDTPFVSFHNESCCPIQYAEPSILLYRIEILPLLLYLFASLNFAGISLNHLKIKVSVF